MEQFKGINRLPKFAVPKRYLLKLQPDLSACKFTGTVEIDIDVAEETKFLVLNAAELVIDSTSIWFETHHSHSDSSQRISPSKLGLFEEDEILVLVFNDLLPLGKATLGIGFSGIVNDKLRGFYKCSYEMNGEMKNMAATQFEPANARMCFPCWDEPASKATFKISVEAPSELVVLSNMPIIDERLDGNLKIVSFDESPLMSTYLVAVVVGLFDHIEDKTDDGTVVRVYCQVGKTDQGKFSLDVAIRSLHLFTKYFETPYLLPKLDIVVISDFASGAMENYGLIIGRDTCLLYDDRHSSADSKQWVATVVAHEVAHMWFGNFVTLEWWTHLWLNEGFATWVSYFALDNFFPEWKIWNQFLCETSGGLRLDALAESHPIEVEVQNAHGLDEIFDAISYKKGCSVIQWLQSYLGVETFQRGLASYMKRFACANANTGDLWAVLSEESGEPVDMIMGTWTKQKGYPVIYVNIKDGELEFEQSQFLSDGSAGDGQWIVPIILCCGSYDRCKNFLLQTKASKLDVSELSLSSVWIKLNVEQAGFYRVKYEDELAARIMKAIKENQLSTTDRYGILDDSYALCEACMQPLSSLLYVIDAYKEELDYTVLSLLIDITYNVINIASDAIPKLSNDLEQFFITLLQFSAEKLGWNPKPGESHLDGMLRGELLTILSILGHEMTLTELHRRFHAFLEDRNTSLLPADMRKAAYIAVMRSVTTSNRSGYESLLRIYREIDIADEKARVLRSLASSSDPDIVLEVLNFFLSSEVRSQDIVHAFKGLRWESRETAWIWLNEKWDIISEKWGSNMLLTHFIKAIVPPFSTEEKAAEIEAFFESRSKPSINRTLKQSIERVRINARWVNSIQNEQHSPLEELLTPLKVE